MIDAQGGKEMNKQRKVVVTITYNEMGIIVDTKAEELGSSAQPEPAIPISWLMKEIERLEKRDGFAKLDAVQLRVLIKRWRGEQDDR